MSLSESRFEVKVDLFPLVLMFSNTWAIFDNFVVVTLVVYDVLEFVKVKSQ